MRTFRVELISKEEIAKDTLLLEFQKPVDFEFKPGQFIMIIMPTLERDVEGGNQRAMSIASPPYFENLQIIFRKSESPFKKAVEGLNLGDEFEIKGPFGFFTLEEEEKISEIVFLAGGTGIAPIRSILLESIKKNSQIEFFLFYSNLRSETAAFLEELQKVASPNFKLICTMTEVGESEETWKGERGFVNLEMLAKYIPDIKKPVYYIVGPPPFVEAMKKMLEQAGVDEKNIKLEKF